jgi:hypothetical protein
MTTLSGVWRMRAPLPWTAGPNEPTDTARDAAITKAP